MIGNFAVDSIHNTVG